MSGTNDKAGSSLNLLRWISPRTIQETFVPATQWRYPYLGRSAGLGPPTGALRRGQARQRVPVVAVTGFTS